MVCFEGALELASGAEVTKGPGSVLYGSNAVHGLVNILIGKANKGSEFIFGYYGE